MNLGRAPAGALAAGLFLLSSCIDFPDAKGYACEVPNDCGSGRSCAEGQCVDLAPLSADEPHYGKTLAQWAVVWAQWWQSLPSTHNPLYDSTGEDCASHQPDPSVFMLAGVGSWQSASVIRTCDQVGKLPMLVPLFFWLEFDKTKTEQDLQNDVTGATDTVDTLTLEIDGKPMASLRAGRIHPQRFSFTEDSTDPMDPSLTDLGDFNVDPAFMDGFFVLLPPLPSGEHTLHFGSLHADGTEMDSVYHMEIP